MLKSVDEVVDEVQGVNSFNLAPIGATQTGQSYTIRLRNLPPGTYTLRPSALMGYEVNNITSRSVRVTITDIAAFNSGPQSFLIEDSQGAIYRFYI